MVNKKISKKSNVFQYAAILCILFTCGFLGNLWITEHYGTYNKIELSWSHFEFYAATGIHDVVNVQNVSSKKAEYGECLVPRLGNDNHPKSVTCKRPVPIPDSCKIAEKIFHSKPTPDCSHQKKYEICKIKDTTMDNNVNCTNDICTSNITIGITDPLNGALKWTRVINTEHLEKHIRSIMATDELHGNYGFCFLKCTPELEKFPENVTTDNLTIASQLLLLPSNMSKFRCTNETVCKNGINVNIIWLDSTSHSHFYRSMPKSVAAFRKVKENEKAFVFNYNLMQSMAGGTYVNTVAFTSGKTVSRGTLLKKHIPIGELFNLYKDGGYHVAWMDDLCWKWSIESCACGIPRFLGVTRKNVTYATAWKNIRENLVKKGVDNIGMSLANCEIMRLNNMTDPFKDTRKDSVAICYNGYYQTHYLFASMQMLQKQLTDIRRPFFHFLDLNLGHESSGRRIQTLDESLAKFVEFLSNQDNTLTLMFGDHGNKYGAFVRASKEAKLEMAHTILFAVASKNLEFKLGRDKLQALDINQNRMVNIFDLRNTVLTLAPTGTKTKQIKTLDNHPLGLFHPIAENRTCELMGIAPEAAKCICEQGKIDTSAKNDTEVRLIADFALGLINNKIQAQFMAANADLQMGFGSCHRLVGSWISNLQKTVVGDLIVTDLNIHVPAGNKATQDEDIFSVVVHVAQNKSNITMEFVHYERITTYSVYDKCRDTGVDGDICVCDLDKTNHTLELKQWHTIPQIVFGQMTTIASLDGCLFVYERRTLHGLVLETSCDCRNKHYGVLLQIVTQSNVVTSKLSSLMIRVDSGTMTFLCAFHQLSKRQPWFLDYDVKFRELSL